MTMKKTPHGGRSLWAGLWQFITYKFWVLICNMVYGNYGIRYNTVISGKSAVSMSCDSALKHHMSSYQQTYIFPSPSSALLSPSVKVRCHYTCSFHERAAGHWADDSLTSSLNTFCHLIYRELSISTSNFHHHSKDQPITATHLHPERCSTISVVEMAA